MSNKTYEFLWVQSLIEIEDVIYIEDPQWNIEPENKPKVRNIS